MTNADMLRAKSDRELCAWICGLFTADDCGGCPFRHHCNPGHNGLAAWMKRPAGPLCGTCRWFAQGSQTCRNTSSLRCGGQVEQDGSCGLWEDAYEAGE